MTLLKSWLIAGLLAASTLFLAEETGGSPKERPVVNLPMALRQSNYTCCWRHRDNGSCVHVSWIMLLRWQNELPLATWWKAKYKGGENHYEFCSRLNAAGIRYATTFEQSDISFLDWAIKTRRGCITGIGTDNKGNGPTHMVCLVYLDHTQAGILDNNDIGKIHYMPRQEFLDLWVQSHSWATTPMYHPCPPLPVL